MGVSSWIYLVLLVLSLGTARLLSRLFPLAVSFGSLTALVFSLFALGPLYEAAIAVASAGLFLLLFRLRPSRRETALEAMVGHTCTVTEKICPLTGGQVRLGDGLWAARGLSQDESYEEGAVLTVVAVEGVKLICR